MTWSVVARDRETSAFGVSISTCHLAVGSTCPWLRSGVGAVSTQATTNPLYGAAILDLMADGVTAAEAIESVTSADAGRDHRQVHAIDARGRNGAHTGTRCFEWCGHLVGDDVSVAGNMLANERVVAASLDAWNGAAGAPFAERLLAALDAGQQAGGDKRGRQSAALIVYSSEVYPDIDLRVDDHPDPVAELLRLYEVAKEVSLPALGTVPRAGNPAGIYDPDEWEASVAAFEAAEKAKR